MEFVANHRKGIMVTGVIILSVIITLSIVKLIQIWPVNLAKTDLSKASQSTIDKAANQVTIDIKNLPDQVDDETKAMLDNLLAYILRQKYGAKSVNFTASVRAVAGYNATGLGVYVDVPEANETYVGTINLKNHVGSFSCAPDGQQMSPNSNCEDMLVPDVNIFPNG